MGKKNRGVDGYVIWLKSRRTGRLFPSIVFSGDTDMATEGFIALTSTERVEIVVTEMTGPEWNDQENGDKACARRVNQALGRTDLRAVRLLRAEETFEAPKGISFQEYQRLYTPPRYVYSDIHDPKGGEADMVSEQSFGEFQAENGTIIFHEM